MDTSYNIGNEMDANMFNQYMYKRPEENLDVSLSVPQYNGHPPPSHLRYHNLNDQTFHTPSFGDEEFDIPVMHHQQPPPQHHQLDQYHQMHNHQMSLMNDQQAAAAAAYSQHQWHHQQSTAESHMMANQTYQLHSPNHSNYHHMSSPNQQMLLMQPPSAHQPPPTQNQHQQQQQQQQQQQSHQPQMSPQLNTGGNNYIGQSPPQTVRSNENGSTSDDSDDNALNDPNANNTFKRPSPDPYIGNDSPNRNNSTMKTKAPPVRKPKASKKKKKKDPNEPQKPVSAYALFFRDTQASIKGQNPNASFGEVSKIVASMWDVLAPDHKNVYKKRTEVAKKEYLKALAAYRASLVSQGTESESQSPPHQQKPAPPAPQATHKIQNQQPPSQHMQQQQNMPPGARMSPHHQMPPSYVQSMPPHNYQPPPGPYTPPSPYGSPQQPLIYPMNPNMMQPPPHNGMMNMQQQPGPQYINQQGYIDQQQQQQPTSQQQSEMLVFS